MASTHPIFLFGSYKSPWKFICSTVDLVASRAHCRLGDRCSALLWKDSSLSCGILKTGRLFRHTNLPFSVVADVWVADIAEVLRLRRNLSD